MPARTQRLITGWTSERFRDEDYEILLEALDTVGAISTISEDSVKTKPQVSKMVDLSPSPLMEERKDSTVDKVRFHLTPSMTAEGLIAVNFRPEGSREDRGHLNASEQKDMIIEVKDGSTIVIGRMFKDVLVESSWKVPLLGDLPFLGFVFRNQGEELRKSEIITFLTIGTIEKESNNESYAGE